MVDLIILIGEIIFLISYLFKDILYLRIITLGGLLSYIIAGLVAGFHVPGMTPLIIFTALGFLINIYQIALIIISRQPILLPDEIKDLYTNNFKIMTPKEFYKFYKMADVKKYTQKEVLATQNQPISNLLLLKDGTVDIIKNNTFVTHLSAGFFIGEMSFLTGEMATATVEVASPEIECIIWEKTKLAKLQHKEPELYEKVRQVIALNLVKKLDRK